MLRFTCLLASVCVVLGGCGPSVSGEDDITYLTTNVDPDGRVTMIAYRVPDGAITIDGLDDDWGESHWRLDLTKHEPGPEMWSLSDESRGKYFGRDDCSVALYFAHDTDYLYILAEVRDQALFNNAPPESPNLGDDLELFIDASGPEQRFADTNSENTRQIMLVAGDINPAWREPFIWQSSQTAEKPRAASRLTPWGYTMEIAIPKASFPYWKEHPELDAIGFDGIVCDADAPGVDIHHPAQKGALFFATYAQHFLKPTHLALLVLEKEKSSRYPSRARYEGLPWRPDFITYVPVTTEQVLEGLAAFSSSPTKFIPGADLAHSHVSPRPAEPGATPLAQWVLNWIDDPRAGEVAARAVASRSHRVAKAGMLVLARRPSLPLPESFMEDVTRLAGRKDPEAIAAVNYAMEALAVRGQFPVQDMFKLVKPADEPSMSLTFMYCCGLNGDKAATPVLLTLLKDDPNFRMRMMAALALSMLKDPAALDALQEATADKNGDVRLQAADAIKKIQAAGEAK